MAAEGSGEHADRVVNRFELVSRWADDLAHEIKNPFHAMAINLELVKRRAGDEEGLKERAGVVESELRRVHDLIDAVLKLVRPWPDTDAADVAAVFDALLPVFRARAGLRGLEYRHEAGGGYAALPPGDLAQVILNLMDNAVTAAGGGGRIVTRCVDAEGRARIEVTDTGGGLGGLEADPFEPGVSGWNRSGLGLPVSRRLVRRVGGTLVLEPAGRGVTAAVVLPRPGGA